jgi:hypothetical protein
MHHPTHGRGTSDGKAKKLSGGLLGYKKRRNRRFLGASASTKPKYRPKCQIKKLMVQVNLSLLDGDVFRRYNVCV